MIRSTETSRYDITLVWKAHFTIIVRPHISFVQAKPIFTRIKSVLIRDFELQSIQTFK